MTNDKPWLNFGAGKIIMPMERPTHHQIVEAEVYALDRQWVNADVVNNPGIDELVSMTEYPFPWADDTFGGVLLGHVVEHLPHEIKIAEPKGVWLEDEQVMDGVGSSMQIANALGLGEFVTTYPAYEARVQRLKCLQDGWYAFWSELNRVTVRGAVAHVLAPYGSSSSAMADPTHRRLIVEQTFTHCLMPQEDDAVFKYETDCYWQLMQQPAFHLNNIYDGFAKDNKWETLQYFLMSQFNVVHAIYVKLENMKPDGETLHPD